MTERKWMKMGRKFSQKHSAGLEDNIHHVIMRAHSMGVFPFELELIGYLFDNLIVGRGGIRTLDVSIGNTKRCQLVEPQDSWQSTLVIYHPYTMKEYI